MQNSEIADNFSMLAKLIDIHGDNSFKAKSYASAAFAIEKLPSQLSDLPPQKIASLKGIGESTAKKIGEQLSTGRLADLDSYIMKTPVGILEMMKMKGLGPKKIATIWKELEIESIGELLYACNENRLSMYKGFGQKTQQALKENIEFYLSNQGSYLYSQVEDFAAQFTETLQKELGGIFLLTGDARRHAEVIHRLEWVTTNTLDDVKTYFDEKGYFTEVNDQYLAAKGSENIAFHFFFATQSNIGTALFTSTASPAFLQAWMSKYPDSLNQNFEREEEIFSREQVQFIPPYLRETEHIVGLAALNQLPSVIEPGDIKGIIHSHSNWSDGTHTIEQMAKAAINLGLQYLVISDHSKSAFYANGLFPDRLREQHKLIDELNSELAPFHIFKSIESDILNDGSLDYDDEVLSWFDLVIASVHSNLKMNAEKATQRLLKAIENPFTNILGHMTGRLLLSRAGYPADHEAIIDACLKNNVAIELNAHPRRLDMDWRWLPTAIEKGVLISIDPDAHSIEAFTHTRYGVLAAKKGGLTAAGNLSSFSLSQFREFIMQQQEKRKSHS